MRVFPPARTLQVGCAVYRLIWRPVFAVTASIAGGIPISYEGKVSGAIGASGNNPRKTTHRQSQRYAPDTTSAHAVRRLGGLAGRGQYRYANHAAGPGSWIKTLRSEQETAASPAVRSFAKERRPLHLPIAWRRGTRPRCCRLRPLLSPRRTREQALLSATAKKIGPSDAGRDPHANPRGRGTERRPAQPETD